jgi:hypothetical protein
VNRLPVARIDGARLLTICFGVGLVLGIAGVSSVAAVLYLIWLVNRPKTLPMTEKGGGGTTT